VLFTSIRIYPLPPFLGERLVDLLLTFFFKFASKTGKFLSELLLRIKTDELND